MKKVYIDSTIAGLGITNCNYWFNAFSNCTEVRGFENLSGMTRATFAAGMATFSYPNLNYLFYSCTNFMALAQATVVRAFGHRVDQQQDGIHILSASTASTPGYIMAASWSLSNQSLRSPHASRSILSISSSCAWQTPPFQSSIPCVSSDIPRNLRLPLAIISW